MINTEILCKTINDLAPDNSIEWMTESYLKLNDVVIRFKESEDPKYGLCVLHFNDHDYYTGEYLDLKSLLINFRSLNLLKCTDEELDLIVTKYSELLSYESKR